MWPVFLCICVFFGLTLLVFLLTIIFCCCFKKNERQKHISNNSYNEVDKGIWHQEVVVDQCSRAKIGEYRADFLAQVAWFSHVILVIFWFWTVSLWINVWPWCKFVLILLLSIYAHQAGIISLSIKSKHTQLPQFEIENFHFNWLISAVYLEQLGITMTLFFAGR